MPGRRTLVSRTVPLGGVRQMEVQRTLPHRDLPTVGPWCFVDHFGPSRETMTVLPHPHIGLQTVTWPLAGEIRHRDSLGNEQVLRPGELNLMTAGEGVAHSEFGLQPGAAMHGVQLWVALPETIRRGPPGFEHHSELPRAQGPGWAATVFMGELVDVRSPATVYSPMVGAEVTVTGGFATVSLRRDFEHAVMGLDGPLRVDGEFIETGALRYLPTRAESVDITAARGRRMLLLGGTPFAEELVMWWNFVGRSHDDIVEAREAWNGADGGPSRRFGFVGGHNSAWIPAPPLPGVRLRPRRRR